MLYLHQAPFSVRDTRDHTLDNLHRQARSIAISRHHMQSGHNDVRAMMVLERREPNDALKLVQLAQLHLSDTPDEEPRVAP